MRVLLVSSSSGSRGGGEIYLQRLARGLCQLGHEVHFACSDHSRMDELTQQMSFLRVHRLNVQNMYDRPTRLVGAILDRAQVRRVELALRELSPDVIHLNQQVTEDGLDLLLGAKRTAIPLVSTIHIVHSAQALGAKLGFLRDAIATRVLRASEAIYIVVAEQAGRTLARRLGLDPSSPKIQVVHNGVWERDTELGRAVRQQMREEWGASPDTVLLGCVGRLERQKDPLFILEVLTRLRKNGVPARFVWIGDGPLKDDLRNGATILGEGEAVILDGWRPDARLRMAGLDIFVMASRFEGLPLALLESMCVGIPCCVSDVDGMPEAVVDGVNGYICGPGDLETWTTRLVSLAEDPVRRREMGQRALEVVKSHFSLRGMAEQTEAIYRAAIDNHATRRSRDHS